MGNIKKQTQHILSKKERFDLTQPSQPVRANPREEKEPKGYSYCWRCGSILFNKKWSKDQALTQAQLEGAEINLIMCPSCREITDPYPEGMTPRGILEIKGKLTADLWNLVKNVVRFEETLDPLKRILKSDKGSDSSIIYFSNSNLAVAVGKKLEAAHKKSSLKIEYMERDNELVRVTFTLEND